MSLMSGFKGFVGESVINLATWLMLDKQIYHRLNNITLPLANGGSTQIDHIIVSIYGIFVIETKHYKGWIFGSENQAQWTQAFPNGSKYKFQNPLRQNYLHLKTLAELLALDMHYFHSIVVFIGECELKTPDELPKNVMKRGMVTYIKAKQHILLTESDVQSIIEQIESNRFAKSRRTNRQHKAYLQNKHGNQALKNEPVKALGAPPITKQTSQSKPIPQSKIIPQSKPAIKTIEVQRWSGQTLVETAEQSLVQSSYKDDFYITPFAVTDFEPYSHKFDAHEVGSNESIKVSALTETVHCSTIANTIPTCPKCYGEMVERMAKKGARQGQKFYGCLQFPKCRGIVNVN